MGINIIYFHQTLNIFFKTKIGLDKKIPPPSPRKKIIPESEYDLYNIIFLTYLYLQDKKKRTIVQMTAIHLCVN